MTNPLIELERVARISFPGIGVRHEPPLHAEGAHLLDLRWEGRLVMVAWRLDDGFRIAEIEDDGAFDSVPSIRVTVLADAIANILRLLRRHQASASA